MLERLRVSNLILIREADLEFGPGLNVVTGETGAGKTILLGALGLVLGGRADATLVGPGGREAYVEALFGVTPAQLEDEAFGDLRELVDDDEDGLALARRVGQDGRGRALAGGRATTRGALERAGARLLGIVSQHEARSLARPAVQRDLLDGFLGEEQAARRSRMARAWQDLGEARRAVEAAEAEASGAERLTEDLEAIAARVEAVAPAPGEEAALRAERERLRHADVLAAAAAGAAALLNPEEGEGAQALAARAERLLRPAEDLDERLATTGDELREALVRLEEAAHTLHAYASAVDHDPRRLDAVEERLERLDDLVRRHGSLDAALAAAGAARERLERLAHRDDDLRALRSRLADAEAEAATAAAALTEARQAGSGPFAAAIERQLGDLGMADAGVEVRLERREAGPSGADEVALLVAPNPGLPPGPVRQIASGGELSRITLAIRVAAHEREGGGTLVFDEIDAGVGGRTARAVADKLVALAATEQLICITHLPQIAARADRHFRVVKEAGDPTVTRIDELDEAAAEDELARMLGAEEGSAEALQLARSLRARPR